MGSINEKLTYLDETKTLIKNAIIEKGVAVQNADTLREYATKIGMIEQGDMDFSLGPYPDPDYDYTYSSNNLPISVAPQITPTTWTYPTDWYNLEQILSQHSKTGCPIKLICQLINVEATTSLYGADYYITSDGVEYQAESRTTAIQHTWDTTQDKVGSNEQNYRWVIYFYTSAVSYASSSNWLPKNSVNAIITDGFVWRNSDLDRDTYQEGNLGNTNYYNTVNGNSPFFEFKKLVYFKSKNSDWSNCYATCNYFHRCYLLEYVDIDDGIGLNCVRRTCNMFSQTNLRTLNYKFPEYVSDVHGMFDSVSNLANIELDFTKVKPCNNYGNFGYLCHDGYTCSASNVIVKFNPTWDMNQVAIWDMYSPIPLKMSSCTIYNYRYDGRSDLMSEFIKSGRFYASNDGKTWTQIGTLVQKNNTQSSQTDVILTCSDFYHYFRFEGDSRFYDGGGVNYNPSHNIYLGQIKYFGITPQEFETRGTEQTDTVLAEAKLYNLPELGKTDGTVTLNYANSFVTSDATAITRVSGDSWYLTTSGYTGLRNNGIGDNGTTSCYFKCYGTGTVSWDCVVSSEGNYDWGWLFIDGQQMFKISGSSTSISSYTFTTGGEHTLEFRYTKDGSSSSGNDAVYIRSLVYVYGKDRGYYDGTNFYYDNADIDGFVDDGWLISNATEVKEALDNGGTIETVTVSSSTNSPDMTGATYQGYSVIGTNTLNYGEPEYDPQPYYSINHNVDMNWRWWRTNVSGSYLDVTFPSLKRITSVSVYHMESDGLISVEIQGSVDGTTYTTLGTISNLSYDTFNTIQISDTTEYLHLRAVATIDINNYGEGGIPALTWAEYTTKQVTGVTVEGGDPVEVIGQQQANYDLYTNFNNSKHLRLDYNSNVFVQPVLTSNGTLGGNSFAVQSSSDWSESYPAWYAVDGSTSTWWASSGNSSSDFIFYNPIPLNVTQLSWSSSPTYPNEYTTGGSILGSNDGTTWTTIMSYTNSTPNTIISLSSNTNYYKYYKISSTGYQESDFSITDLVITATSENPIVEYTEMPSDFVYQTGKEYYKIYDYVTFKNSLYQGYEPTFNSANVTLTKTGETPIVLNAYVTTCIFDGTWTQPNFTSDNYDGYKLRCNAMSRNVSPYKYFVTQSNNSGRYVSMYGHNYTDNLFNNFNTTNTYVKGTHNFKELRCQYWKANYISFENTQNVKKAYFRYSNRLYGVVIPHQSNITDWQYAFADCTAMSTAPSIKFCRDAYVYYMFYNCTALYDTHYLDFSEIDTIDTGMFTRCSSGNFRNFKLETNARNIYQMTNETSNNAMYRMHVICPKASFARPACYMNTLQSAKIEFGTEDYTTYISASSGSNNNYYSHTLTQYNADMAAFDYNLFTTGNRDRYYCWTATGNGYILYNAETQYGNRFKLNQIRLEVGNRRYAYNRVTFKGRFYTDAEFTNPITDEFTITDGGGEVLTWDFNRLAVTKVYLKVDCVDSGIFSLHKLQFIGEEYLSVTVGQSISSAFQGCMALEFAEITNTNKLENVQHAFRECTKLAKIPDINWSKVKYADYLFYNNTTITEFSHELPELLTASYFAYGTGMIYYKALMPKVTNLAYAFYNSKITELDLSECECLQNLAYMCYNCLSLIKVIMPQDQETATMTSWEQAFYGDTSLRVVQCGDTSTITNMTYAFYDCHSLVSVSPIDFSACTNVDYMFQNCYGLETLVTTNFNNVTQMYYTFKECQRLKSLNLGNCPKVTSFNYSFYGCNSMESVTIGTNVATNWDYAFAYNYKLATVNIITNSATTVQYMFTYDYALKDIDVNFSNVTQANYVFRDCDLSGTVNFTNTNKLSNATGFFYNTKITEIPDTFTVTSACTSLYSTFDCCHQLVDYSRLSTFVTSSVIDMRYMFASNDFTQFTLNQLTFNSNPKMGYMFAYCRNLTTLTIDFKGYRSGANETNSNTGTDYDYHDCMFREDWNLKTLNLLNTGGLSNFRYMFAYCGIESMDINFGNMSNVTAKTGYMFYGCKYLETVTVDFGGRYLNGSDSSVWAGYMFGQCPKLTTINLKRFYRLAPYMFSSMNNEEVCTINYGDSEIPIDYTNYLFNSYSGAGLKHEGLYAVSNNPLKNISYTANDYIAGSSFQEAKVHWELPYKLKIQEVDFVNKTTDDTNELSTYVQVYSDKNQTTAISSLTTVEATNQSVTEIPINNVKTDVVSLRFGKPLGRNIGCNAINLKAKQLCELDGNSTIYRNADWSNTNYDQKLVPSIATTPLTDNSTVKLTKSQYLNNYTNSMYQIQNLLDTEAETTTWVVNSGNQKWIFLNEDGKPTLAPIRSNSYNSYILSASHVSGNEDRYQPYRAFMQRNKTSDGYCWWTGSNVSLPVWIKVQCPKPIRVTGVTVQNEQYSPEHYSHAKFQGSNDNSTWVTLCELNNEMVAGGKTYGNITDRNSYKYFRLIMDELTDFPNEVANVSIQSIAIHPYYTQEELDESCTYSNSGGVGCVYFGNDFNSNITYQIYNEERTSGSRYMELKTPMMKVNYFTWNSSSDNYCISGLYLYASNDKANWTQLGYWSYDTNGKSATQTCTIAEANRDYYRYYRLSTNVYTSYTRTYYIYNLSFNGNIPTTTRVKTPVMYKPVKYYQYKDANDERATIDTYTTLDEVIPTVASTYPNYQATGTLTVTDGVASGFSTSNFVQIPTKDLDFNNATSVEMMFKYDFASTDSIQCIIGNLDDNCPTGGFVLRTDNPTNRLFMWATASGSTWDIAQFDTGLDITTGVNYIKVVATNGTITTSISADGETWTDGNEATGTFCNFVSGIRLGIAGVSSYCVANASVDLANSYIKIDGELAWTYQRPYKNPKADITLSDKLNINGNYIIDAHDYPNRYIANTGRCPLNTMSKWEVRTKFTYDRGSGGAMLFYFEEDSNNNYSPRLYMRGSQFVMYLSSNGTSWNLANGSTGSFTPVQGTTYYLKFGYTGSGYYAEYNTTGWSDSFTRAIWVGTSTRVKYNGTGLEFINSGSYTSDWIYGQLDLKETQLTLNNAVHWKGVDGDVQADFDYDVAECKLVNAITGNDLTKYYDVEYDLKQRNYKYNSEVTNGVLTMLNKKFYTSANWTLDLGINYLAPETIITGDVTVRIDEHLTMTVGERTITGEATLESGDITLHLSYENGKYSLTYGNETLELTGMDKEYIVLSSSLNQFYADDLKFKSEVDEYTPYTMSYSFVAPTSVAIASTDIENIPNDAEYIVYGKTDTTYIYMGTLSAEDTSLDYDLSATILSIVIRSNSEYIPQIVVNGSLRAPVKLYSFGDELLPENVGKSFTECIWEQPSTSRHDTYGLITGTPAVVTKYTSNESNRTYSYFWYQYFNCRNCYIPPYIAQAYLIGYLYYYTTSKRSYNMIIHNFDFQNHTSLGNNTYDYANNNVYPMAFVNPMNIVNSMSFSSYNLTDKSCEAIIDALMSRVNTNSATLTLGASNLAKLSDAYKAKATEKNWTLA